MTLCQKNFDLGKSQEKWRIVKKLTGGNFDITRIWRKIIHLNFI